MTALKSIGKQWREGAKVGQREVVFTWMDGERWSKWLKSMYGIIDSGTTESPSIIVADHAVRVLRIIPSAVRKLDTYAHLPRTLSTMTLSRTSPRSN